MIAIVCFKNINFFIEKKKTHIEERQKLMVNTVEHYHPISIIVFNRWTISVISAGKCMFGIDVYLYFIYIYKRKNEDE